MITFTITPPPSANRMWANRKGGQKRLSTEYALWLSVAGWEMKTQAFAWAALDGHYELILEVNPGRADLDNLIKPANDLMQKMGVVGNDRDCKRVTITHHEYVDQDHGGKMLVVVKAMEQRK